MKYTEYKSLQEIIDKINSFAPLTRFQIPSDAYGYNSSIVAAEAAIKRLEGYWDWWKNVATNGEETQFYIYDTAASVPCWNADKMEYQNMELVKINMTNSEIKHNATNLNTPLE